MYLGKQIWNRLYKNSGVFDGKMNEEAVRAELQRLVSPYRTTVRIIHKHFRNKVGFLVGGEYTPGKVRRPIELHVYMNDEHLTFNDKNRARFLFRVCMTLQHELVHLLQYENRTNKDKFYSEIYQYSKGSSKAGASLMEYLATVEEIDAYAHDLAMEIKYYYPDEDPMQVLKKVKQYRNLQVWKLYANAFKGARWPHVRNELLRRTYRWLPHTYVA